MPALNAKIKGDDLAYYLANFINFNLDTPLIKGQIIKLDQSIF